MSRYIDIEPIIKDLTAMKKVYDAIALDGMIKALREAPTADVVETSAKCKDCEEYGTLGDMPFCYGWGAPNSLGENGFCTDWERKVRE